MFRAFRIFNVVTGSLLLLAMAACAGVETGGKSPQKETVRSSSIAVGPNIQVSKQNADLFHGEVMIAADPVNSQHLIACSGIWPASSNEGIRDISYVTFDSGRTWKATYTSHVGTEFDLDPVCDIRLNGDALAAGAAASVPGHDFIARSNDGGLHWAAPLVLPWGDRDFMAIDKTHSPYRGRIYYSATNAWHTAKAELSYIGDIYSSDGGKTFSPSVKVIPVTKAGATLDLNGGPVAVLANGHVMILGYKWPDSASPKPIDAFLSTDGGQTFGKSHLVTEATGSTLIGVETHEKGQGATMVPLIATDSSKGPFRGRVYVGWQDFGNSLQASIMLSSSDDEGKTWSQPVQVDDSPPFPARQYPAVFSASLAVNNKGTVAVTWFDGRDLTDGMGGALRMAASNDGGETFGHSVAVASGASLLVPNVEQQKLSWPEGGSGQAEFQDTTRYHVFAGDTQGLAADASGNFHPLWTDNRTGISQLWTANVAVHETPIRHGDVALSSLKDVTNSLGLDITNATYDRTTQTVSADLALVNGVSRLMKVASKKIAGPIYLRVARITSPIGVAELTTSDNGVHGPGAVLRFQARHGSTLTPNAHTQTRHVVFQLSNTHAITAADTARDALSYVSLKYHAYAR